MTFRDKIFISLIILATISLGIFTVRTVISPFIFSLILAAKTCPNIKAISIKNYDDIKDFISNY